MIEDLDPGVSFEKPSGAIVTKQLLTLDDFQRMWDDLQSLPVDTPQQWLISPCTYESIKFVHNFPALPSRKLRKVQLRRIAQRKHLYRAHRARVNTALAKRMGVK